MKGQEIGLLLKLVALRRKEDQVNRRDSERWSKSLPGDWQDWSFEDDTDYDGAPLEFMWDDRRPDCYSVRALAKETGISKSQVSLSLNNCLDVGLIRKDRMNGTPRANARALFDFIVHGARYVFPAKPGAVTRGIATTFAAPALEGKLYSSGELAMVWPDARGNSKGQAIEPLFKSVPYAVRRDRELYAMLALVDAIRLGHPRESNLAAKQLAQYLE